MSQGFGHKFFCGTAEESTYATAVTPPTQFYEVERFGVKATQKYLAKRLLRYVGQARKIKSKQDVGGTVALPLLWTGTERWLKHAFGTVGTTGPVSSNYTHTFTGADALPAGLTLYGNHDADNIGGSSAYQFRGCQISKLTLKQSVEAWLMAEMEIMGADRTLVAKPTPTFPTFDPIDYAQVTVKAINPAGANYDIGLKEFELTLDNGLYADGYRLGSAVRAFSGRGEGGRKVNVKLVAEYKDVTLYNYFRNLVDTDLQIRWTKDANTFLNLTMPKVSFEGEDPSAENAGPYYLNMEATGYIGTTDGDEVTLVLQNQTASV